MDGSDKLTDIENNVHLGESTNGMIICQGSSAVSRGAYNEAVEKCQTLGKRIKTNFTQTDIDKSLAEMKAWLKEYEQREQKPRYIQEFWTGEKFIG